jgi:hypothetical protein
MKKPAPLPITNTDTLRVDPDPKVLQRFRQGCRVSFELYADLASRSLAQLCLTSASCPLGRLNLELLIRKENKAHGVYLKARSELVKCIFGAAKAVREAPYGRAV